MRPCALAATPWRRAVLPQQPPHGRARSRRRAPGLSAAVVAGSVCGGRRGRRGAARERPAGRRLEAADAAAVHSAATAPYRSAPAIRRERPPSLSGRRISRSTPSAGAGTSTVTLSVSISISGSFSTTSAPDALEPAQHLRAVSLGLLGRASTVSMWSCSILRRSRRRARSARSARRSARRPRAGPGVRARDVRHREPLDRRVEVEECFSREHCGDFGAESRGHRVLVNDDAAARLARPRRARPRGPMARPCAGR